MKRGSLSLQIAIPRSYSGAGLTGVRLQPSAHLPGLVLTGQAQPLRACWSSRDLSYPQSTITRPEAKTCAWETESHPRVVTTRCSHVRGPEDAREGEVDERQVSDSRPDWVYTT